jgi:hypothetical protein
MATGITPRLNGLIGLRSLPGLMSISTAIGSATAKPVRKNARSLLVPVIQSPGPGSGKAETAPRTEVFPWTSLKAAEPRQVMSKLVGPILSASQ